jgi:hypothetical protein
MTHGNELHSSLVFIYSNTQQQENLHLHSDANTNADVELWVQQEIVMF